MSSFFGPFGYNHDEPDEYLVSRAVDVIKQATEIRSDPELMAKVAEALACEHEVVTAALDEIPELLADAKESDYDDDVDSKLKKLFKRLGISRS